MNQLGAKSHRLGELEVTERETNALLVSVFLMGFVDINNMVIIFFIQ